MRKTTKFARKIAAGIIGFPLLLVGIILIPLPGPGLVTCFLAFMILSLEFDWAQSHLDKAKSELRKLYKKAKTRADRIENLGNKDGNKYPLLAEELMQLVQEDQDEWRTFARINFESNNTSSLNTAHSELREKVRQRTHRMLTILDTIGQPSLRNIGAEAARALSVLATHSSLTVMRQVLQAFTISYERNKHDTYCQAIPPLTDYILLLERQPQRFGTQWLLDEHKKPFLPTVQNFAHVNERRAQYGIEPLRWPKSLAIPKSQQPWLSRPLSELIMRDPTDKEYADFAQDYLN